MSRITITELTELQSLRQNPIVVYSTTINDDSVKILYECLQKMGHVRHLDLVLLTAGGVVTTARRLAMLLREFTSSLSILVPYKATSAGTLLCLSANELVLGVMAELGPIDVNIASIGFPPSDAPALISSEDIRAFRRMAEDWFDVTRKKDHTDLLALVTQRIFPISLSSFYRFDKLVRQSAEELLMFQLPDAESHIRSQIIEKLVEGYNSHSAIITRSDAKALGLQVQYTNAKEETLLWKLQKKVASQQLLDLISHSEEDALVGLITSSEFCALNVRRWLTSPRQQEKSPEQEDFSNQRIPHASWEIVEE